MELYEYLLKEDAKKGTNKAYEYLVKTKGEKYAKQTIKAAKKKHYYKANSSIFDEINPIVYFIIGIFLGYMGGLLQYEPNMLEILLKKIEQLRLAFSLAFELILEVIG